MDEGFLENFLPDINFSCPAGRLGRAWVRQAEATVSALGRDNVTSLRNQPRYLQRSSNQPMETAASAPLSQMPNPRGWWGGTGLGKQQAAF